jgi:hypothetical protein
MGSVVAQYVTGQTLVGVISDNGHHAERAIGEFIGREAPGTVGHRPCLAASLRRLDRLVPAGIHSVLAGGRQAAHAVVKPQIPPGRCRRGIVLDHQVYCQAEDLRRVRARGVAPAWRQHC